MWRPLVVRRHHLPQNIIKFLPIRLHQVHGYLVHVWAATVDPGDRALCDSQQLFTDVHVVVGNAEGFRYTLDRKKGQIGIIG